MCGTFKTKMADTEGNDVTQSSDGSKDVAQSRTSRRKAFYKRKQLTIADKKAIIDRIDNGEKQTRLSREYGTASSTISDIYKNRAKLEEFYSMSVSPIKLGRMKMRRANDEVLDKVVYNWFVHQVHKGVDLTGPMIMEYAKKMDQQINGGEGHFKATPGWLKCFKSRHGLKGFSLVNSDQTAGDVFDISYKQALHEYIESKNLRPDQVYSADESVLCWRCVPDKAVIRNIQKKSKQIAEDHVTFLCCTNSTGEHRQKILVIGQEKNPSCFAHVNPENLPVIYKHHKNAKMSASLFKEWFNQYFVPSVNTYMAQKGLPKQALLILDNCPSHWPKAPLTSGCGKVECMFLPDRAKAKVQPMQCGIVQMLKRNYRKSLLQTLLNEVDPAKDIKGATASLSIKDAGYMLLDGWLALEQDLIMKAWSYGLDIPPAAPDMAPPINVYEPFNDLVQLAAEVRCEYNLSDTVESSVILSWLKVDDSAITEEEPESQGGAMSEVLMQKPSDHSEPEQMPHALLDDASKQSSQATVLDTISSMCGNQPVLTQTTHQNTLQLPDNDPAFNLPIQELPTYVNSAGNTRPGSQSACNAANPDQAGSHVSQTSHPAGSTGKVPTEQEAIHHAGQLLVFLEAQSHINPKTIIQLRGIQNMLKQRRAYTAKQKRLVQTQEYYAI